MKYLFDERVEKGYPDEQLLTASQSRGVIPKADYGSRTVEAQKDLHLLKLVEPGDYVISLRSFQGGIEYAHVRGIISPAYTVLQPKPEVRRGYYEHFFKSADFINSMTLFVTGIREGQNIDYVRLSRAYMPVPPPEEQEAIGRFIRHLDQRVNRLIKTKRRFIELLNEQKQAIIHRAVTRGFDPTVPLKPSGIEWLGDVPSNWQVVGNRSVFSERRETGEAQLPLLEVSLRTGVRVASELDHFGRPRKEIEDRTKYQTAREGDIAYNMMRMWQGAVGVVPEDGLISPAYVVAKVDGRLHPLFAELVFRTSMYMGAVNRYSKGIVSDRNRLYWDDFKQLPFLLPPRHEQDAILATLTESTSDLQSAITKANAEIDFIREYRTRLVADVVTGLLDIRHLDLPEVEESLIEAIDAGDEDESQELEEEQEANA